MDAQVYDLLKETLALAGTLGVSFLGTIHALKRWQAGREAKDVQQDAPPRATGGAPLLCPRVGHPSARPARQLASERRWRRPGDDPWSIKGRRMT